MLSYTLVLHGTSSTLSSTYVPPLQMDGGDWEIALLTFEVFNSIPNIENSILTFGKQTIPIPIGTYELSDLESYIKSKISKDEVFELRGNRNTLMSELKSSQAIEIDEKLATLLGFTQTRFDANVLYISEQPVDILPVRSLRVEVNIASGSYLLNPSTSQSVLTHSIGEIFIDTPPGYKILEQIDRLIYYPVNTSRLSEIVVQLCDHSGKLVNFRGELVSIRLHLRKRQ